MLTGTTTSGEEPRGDWDARRAEVAEPALLTAQFSSSPRGASLARRLAVRRMEEWGFPADSDVSCAVALVVGELAANA
ncbi:ATP-binding protein, partial [Streptomyces sp. RY43-2]|nr:ATP-binding protein [Streptomyces macrolidinus]